MPVDKQRYPETWNEISLQAKRRAGWRCQFCGVAHGDWVYRDGNGVFVWQDRSVLRNAGYRRPPFEIQCQDGVTRKVIQVVLTTAHLGVPKEDGTPGDKHDKHDCRPENLAALCQRCHLRLDIDEHRENASRTRARKRLAAGNLQLLEEPV